MKEIKRKKKADIRIVLIIILVIVFIIEVYFYNGGTISFKSAETTEAESTTETSEAEVEIQTIENTISSSGQVASSLDEELSVHSTYYLSEILVEEQEYVEEGQNLIKYTNGTYMTAPYNCVIISLNLPDVSSQCTNKHYIEVYALETLSMTISVEEDELSEVSIGQEVDINVTAIDKEYTGYITNISNVGTYSSRGTTFEATVEFENDGDIKIGMSATCGIILEKAENVLSVPNEAITTTNGTSYVTVINSDSTTEQTQIEIGISNDAYTEIISGLTEGQKVQITKSTTSSSNKGSMSFMQDMQSGGSDMQFDKSMKSDSAMPSGEMPTMPN